MQRAREVLAELEVASRDLHRPLDALVEGTLRAGGYPAAAEFVVCAPFHPPADVAGGSCALCWRPHERMVRLVCTHALCAECGAWWAEREAPSGLVACPARCASSSVPYSAWGTPPHSLQCLEAALARATVDAPCAEAVLLAGWAADAWAVDATLAARWPASVVLAVEAGSADEAAELLTAAGGRADVRAALLRWRRTAGAASHAALSSRETLAQATTLLAHILARELQRCGAPLDPALLARDPSALKGAIADDLFALLAALAGQLWRSAAATAAVARARLCLDRAEELAATLADADCFAEVAEELGVDTATRLASGWQQYPQPPPDVSLEAYVALMLASSAPSIDSEAVLRALRDLLCIDSAEGLAAAVEDPECVEEMREHLGAAATRALCSGLAALSERPTGSLEDCVRCALKQKG